MFEGEFLEAEVTAQGAGVLGPFVANLRPRTGSARLGVRSPPFSPPPPPPPPAPSLLLAAVGTWPWSLRKATGRGGAGVQGEAELGAGLGARGRPLKPQGPQSWAGAGRPGRIGRRGRGLWRGGGALGKRRPDAPRAAGRAGLRVPRRKGGALDELGRWS